MLEHDVTPGLVSQGAKCEWVWLHQIQGCIVSLWLRLMVPTAPATLWSLGSAAGGPQWLQGLLSSSVATLGPASRD